jgi:transcriptional regulator with XRE-family HTH domain
MTKSNSRGYSLRTVKQVEAADPTLPGVRLAKVCIARDIPVVDVAAKFGVSRVAVYSWFTGHSKPRQKQLELIEEILKKLTGSAA